MPEDRSPPGDVLANDLPARFVDLVNVDVEISVDDVSACCYENRCSHNAAKYGRMDHRIIAGKNRNQDTVMKKSLGKGNEEKVGPSDQFKKCNNLRHAIHFL